MESLWWQAGVVLWVLGAVALIGMEPVRSIVDRRRRRIYGAGGTGDIAICGLIIAGVALAGSFICLVAWAVTHFVSR